MAIEIDGKLVLAGAGKMGGAMLDGWIAAGLAPGQIIVQDPGPPPEVQAVLERYGIAHFRGTAVVSEAPAIIVVAIKPQVMDEVFPPLAKLADTGTLILSIAAGRTIAGFERHLPPGVAVVRAMPNTPAAIGKGITVCTPNAHVSQRQRALADGLLAAIGEVAWVEHECAMDAVTAVSGSGPAYVFLLAECLAEAGIDAGLEPQLARRLARATVAGSGALLEQSGFDAAELRRNVTSPGGTTAAALDILMANEGMGPLLKKAVAAATSRSKALSG